MKEYELIRQEMMQNNERMANYLNVTFTVVALILTFAVQQNSSVLCIVPIVIILPMYRFVQQTSKAVVKQGAYLYVFLEGKEYNWEHRNHGFELWMYDTRKENKLYYSKGAGKNSYRMLLAACIVVGIYLHIRSSSGLCIEDIAYYVFATILLIGGIAYIKKYDFKYEIVRQSYIDAWTEYAKQNSLLDSQEHDNDNNRDDDINKE